MNLSFLLTGYNLLFAGIAALVTVFLGWRIGINQLEKDTVEMLRVQNSTLKDDNLKLKKENREFKDLYLYHREKLCHISSKGGETNAYNTRNSNI